MYNVTCLACWGRIGPRLLAAVAILCLGCDAQTPSDWGLARSGNFEVYSQAGNASARSALQCFEQLRVFFEQQTTLHVEGRAAVRVIGFASEKEYEAYRLGPTADAYYVGTESRDYIVLPVLSTGKFGLAAHEYAHLMMHAGGLHLPAWLNEGLAEVLSTVTIAENASTVGGDLPGRTQALRRRKWIPLEEVLASNTGSSIRENRQQNEMFYAESWALTDMLVFSPEYAASFQRLMVSVDSGEPGAQALQSIFGKSLDVIARDLRTWVSLEKRVPVQLPGVVAAATAVTVSAVPSRASRSILADLFMANGDLGRASKIYGELALEAQNQGNVHAALAIIRLMEHDYDGARAQWRSATEQGLDDATLCYRFAVFAEDARFSPDEIHSALQRAVSLQPDFDDAQYKLALFERNAGHYQTALVHFSAMRNIPRTRLFGYWLSVASADEELGNHDEAAAAAEKAKEHASTDSERTIAAQMTLVAKTNLEVQVTRDANGREQLTTTRIPRHQTDWNPFIRPDDQMRRLEGTLHEVDCTGETVRLQVDTAEGLLKLAIPDPTRVQIRNGPTQFTCGRQNELRVRVEFAIPDNRAVKAFPVLRGMSFLEQSAAVQHK